MSSTFKFRYLQGGKPSGLLASKGSINEDYLILGDIRIPHSTVLDATARDDRIVMALDTQNFDFPLALNKQLQENHLALVIYGVKADTLKRVITRFASQQAAQAHKQRLEELGEGHLFRTVTCPTCESTVNLSGLPQTSYTYCRFCESVFGEDLNKLNKTNSYGECSECGYYGRIQGYDEAYFYFLIFIFGYNSTRRHLCDACGSSLANKLILINALFILGVPNAIGCAIKTRTGKDPEMKSLSTGNQLAKKGRLAEANEQYRSVLKIFKDHPGVRYNQALAHLKAGKVEEGFGHLQTSIEACGNYGPAIRLLQQLSASR